MELTKQSHEPGRAGADWRSDRREGQVDADGSKGYAAIAQALERHVVDGRHAPGERLTERAVMARFGCTNAAAREVLHILEMSGAIHLTSRRGARIVDERFGKSDAILETWHCLLGLFTSELRAGGTSLPMPPLSTIAGEAPYDRFVALRGWLCDAGRATENEKLATMLTRTAMHLFIVAPDKTDALFREARMSTLEKGRLDRFLDRVDELTQAPRATTLSSTEQIAAYIAERVQFGDLRPGERIRELSREVFRCQPRPGSRRLRLLERDGLVVLRGRRGAFVKDYSAQEMAAIYRIRAEIFGVTTRLAAESATRSSELLQALQEGGRLLIDLTEGHPVADYIRARRGISRTIAALAGNEYLAHVAASLEREISMLWAGLNAEDRRREASRLWQELIAAIVDRKGAAAEAKGREMVMNSLAAILKTRALAAVPLADAP